jgi:uncharacterized membrane protein ArfC
MRDINWWLMAVGFGLAAASTAETDDGETRTARRTAAEPYGAGSIRVAATADGPKGYTIKGNEDSMLYHTIGSPSYKETIAEIWFRTTEAAEDAGFARWDSGKSQRGKL